MKKLDIKYIIEQAGKRKIKQKPFGKKDGYAVYVGKNRIGTYYFFNPDYNEQTGNTSIGVTGYLWDADKNQVFFNGDLIKSSTSASFKDINKNLTESMENANSKTGERINVYDYIQSNIASNVPFQEIQEFQGRIPKSKEQSSKPTHLKSENPTSKKLYKNQIAKIDVFKMQNEQPELYQKLVDTYRDIDSNPFGVIFDSNENNATIIFKNETYMILPKTYLSPHHRRTVVDSTGLKKKYEDAYEYYMENREIDPDSLSLGLIQSMIRYKESNGYTVDDIDRNLLKIKEQQEKQKIEQEKNKDNSWIQKIFNKVR